MQIVDIGDKPTKPGEVPRDKLDRPKIIVPCDHCGTSGKVPSEKVAGRLNQCPKCKGDGHKLKPYTRMTTFIDCLEDKSNLQQWKQRITAIGLSREPGILEAFAALKDPNGEDKNQANALVKRAEEKADADLKALTGTALHDIVEQINRNRPTGFIPDEHKADIAAYVEAMQQAGIKVVQAEAFVVNDELGAGGTFDILGLHWDPVAGRWRLKVMDVKTGRIDYGLSKIGMQLGGYANSVLYDPVTGHRSPIQHALEDGTVLDVDLEEALIIHLPAGKGECTIVPVDIEGAKDGLLLAQQVRKWRSRKFQQDPIVEVKIDQDTLAAA